MLAPLLHLLGCERPKLVESPEPSAKAAAPPVASIPSGFPVRWTLTDIEGRRLEATLIGRSADAVSLVREVDGKRYELPLARLAAADRARVQSLPIRPVPFDPAPAARPDTPSVPAKADPANGVLGLRLAAIEEKQQTAAALRANYAKAVGKIEQRTVLGQIERLEKEIAGLQAEIDALRAPVGLSR